MYVPYIDEIYYHNKMGEDIKNKYLIKASRDIDVLTFNRILKKGYANLTEFQKDIIQEVCCEHASFLFENESMLKTYISNYSINGVSMSFNESWNLYLESGVAISKSLYERLCSTGLCSRSFYYG